MIRMALTLSIMTAVSAVVVLVISVIAFSEINVYRRDLPQHLEDRARIIAEESLASLGGVLDLSPQEQLANAIVLRAKQLEIDEGRQNLTVYNPSQHFFKRRRAIEQSELFNMIRRMPKGAVLHAHDTALIGKDFLLNITYTPDLYMCQSGDDRIQLFFFKTPPASEECRWQLLADLRNASGDVQEFDDRLVRYFTLEVDDPEVAYTDVDVAWEKFGSIFATITPMLTYKPVWEAYFYEALRRFSEDNVLYLELRTTLPDLYDLEGNVYGPEECAAIYKAVNDRFRMDHPDSFGARFIYAPMRMVSVDEARAYVDTATRLREQLGDFFAGFDLVGQEDKGVPLVDLLPALLELPDDIDVFYHAGETNWYGTTTDENLIDAVLLGAKRIGHGYALLKHPTVAAMVKSNDIAVEVNPLSNQVLKLVEDMRNHPAAVMLADGFPVVVSSDDPGLWGGLPLSHDMYMAFVGMSSRQADLRLLKQLALNSIKYSSMPPQEKYFAVSKFTEQWNEFITELTSS